jgi:hypothetical protein
VHLKDQGTTLTTAWLGEHVLKELASMKPSN